MYTVSINIVSRGAHSLMDPSLQWGICRIHCLMVQEMLMVKINGRPHLSRWPANGRPHLSALKNITK